MNVSVSNSDKKKLLTPIKKTILQYGMIEEGDRVAVGLSGGKDSSTLLYVLRILQQQLPFHFDLVPISLTLGFDDMEITPLKHFVENLGFHLHIKETKIGQIVFDYKQEKNPCSLCANLRKGALYDYAKSLECNKVAYGHHLDDAIETFFMNLFFNSKLGTFQPKMYLDQSDITIIRPMITVEERTIIRFVQKKEIPIVVNTCPADKKTKREEMKQLIAQLSQDYPDIRQRFSQAVKNVELDHFWNVKN